jgi:RNA polymerase sigma-70 factor, ECF subfamily
MQAIAKQDIFVVNYLKKQVEQTDLPSMSMLLNEASFEVLFKTNYKPLYAYAFTMVKSELLAEEIVQQVFFKLWEKKEQLSISSSLKAYLYKAVHNDSLNALKHRKVKLTYSKETTYQMRNQVEDHSSPIIAKELTEKIRVALNELPEQCRTIFQMSRFGALKYQEIADQLGLSVKTIENQMGKALKVLRFKLAEYLPTLVWILFNLLNSSN